MGKSRYAIYYCPKVKTPLWQFGARWLAHNDGIGDKIKPLKVEGISPKRLREITAIPRQYGFHATLKPPFRLAKSMDREMLDEALEAFIASHEPLKVPSLELEGIDGFIALRPKKVSLELNDFAAECVKSFDIFRAPPSKKERERRLKADLTKQQMKYLEKWGYPYVMDEYRFHMTLTERLQEDERMAVFKILKRETEDVLTGKPWTLDEITLLRQKKAGEPFAVVKRYPLTPRGVGRWSLKKH